MSWRWLCAKGGAGEVMMMVMMVTMMMPMLMRMRFFRVIASVAKCYYHLPAARVAASMRTPARDTEVIHYITHFTTQCAIHSKRHSPHAFLSNEAEWRPFVGSTVSACIQMQNRQKLCAAQCAGVEPSRYIPKGDTIEPVYATGK